MLEGSHHKFITEELDPDLLSTPFRVQTNWHVITGAPSSSKTTLINLMTDKGIPTVPEAARKYIERGVAEARTIDEMQENLASFERDLIDYHLRFEHGLQASDALFLDTAFPNAVTYCRIVGLDPNEFLAECFHHRYASVFLLDRLPFQQDGVRFEDEVTADFLDKWLARDYIALGYSIVRVPLLPPEERVAFILEKLSKQGLT